MKEIHSTKRTFKRIRTENSEEIEMEVSSYLEKDTFTNFDKFLSTLKKAGVIVWLIQWISL